jgi:HK97 family phage portal protein
MGWLGRISTVALPTVRAMTSQDYNQAFFAGDDLPDLWLARLSEAGVSVSPDLARTLSAYACAVDTIAYDLSTLPLRAFKTRSDGGLDQVLGSSNSHAAGIGALVYKLQWQPNDVQTAVEFWASMIAQLEMRQVAYAEIVPGQSGFMDKLLPRHPDRVTPQRLPNGRLRYRLRESTGGPRFVTQDEMFVIRDLSMDGGLTVMSRVAYAANSIGTGIAAEHAAARFFKTGMTAALLATYVGEMDEEDERALHASISRYAAGVQNSFGLMLVPDDVKVSNLAIEPEKAQMMLAREWTVYEVAREVRISPRKLMVRGKSDGYASAYQDAIDHVVNCLRTRAVLVQQSIQRDLVLAKDVYRFVFHLGELLKGDPAQMGVFIQQLIQSRAMTPSEVRMTYLDMNPDPHLDQLSEGDNRPGQSGGQSATPASSGGDSARAALSRLELEGLRSVFDTAGRCTRRERSSVEKLAQKHANDPDGWARALRAFYADHARYVAELMNVAPAVARGYAATRGEAIAASGALVLEGADGAAWERSGAVALADLALRPSDAQTDAWFNEQPAFAAA